MMINKWYFSGIILNTFILGACANQFNLAPNHHIQNIPVKNILIKNEDHKIIETVLPNNYAYDLFDFAEKKRLSRAPVDIQIEAYEAANKANHPFALERIIEIYQNKLAESILLERTYSIPNKQNVNLKKSSALADNSAENIANSEGENGDKHQKIIDEGDQNNLKFQASSPDENNADVADVAQNIPSQENEIVNLKTLLLNKQKKEANLKKQVSNQNNTEISENKNTHLNVNLKTQMLVSRISQKELETMNGENLKLDMEIIKAKNLVANSINIKPINLKKAKLIDASESIFNIKPKKNINLKEQLTLNKINNLKNQLETVNIDSQQKMITKTSPSLKPIKIETKFYSNKILETYRRILDQNIESKYRFLNQETENLLLRSDAYNYLQMAAKTNNTYAQILLRDYYLNIQKKMVK